jgi:hypothetical protein
VTRRPQLKAMREAAAAAKAFTESAAGRELRETVRRFSESDIAKKVREAAKNFSTVDRSALMAVAVEAKKALAGVLEETEDEAPRRRKGGRPVYHDWAGGKEYMDDYVQKRGLPASKREAIRVASEWFTKVDGGRAPHHRDISKKLIDPLYK